MADPIVQFGGAEGDQLGKWMSAEEKRIKVLQRNANQKLQWQYDIQKKRVEMEGKPARVARRNPWIDKASQGDSEFKLDRKAMIEAIKREEFDRLASVRDEAQRAAEHDVKERKEANQVDRAKKAMEEKAKALSNQNRGIIERAQERVANSQSNLESARKKLEESMDMAQARKEELEKERAAFDKERFTRMQVKHNECLAKVATIKKEKAEKAVTTYNAHQKRFEEKRAVVVAEKEEEIRTKMERQEGLRKLAERKVSAKIGRDDKARDAMWRKFQAKHELADKRLEDRKEYDLSKYETKPKEDWKHYLTDNLKYNQSQGDATQLYHAATYKRSMAIGEELDKRKEAVSRAARELHHEQAKIRAQIKEGRSKNETLLILHGPVSEHTKIPDIKIPKVLVLKPILNYPRPVKPPIDLPQKYHGHGNTR
mmetsp:Transcript_34357/g.57678  ORF Transcript_34357/g.57678 Transcript_34357/m.57678 type:complete len:427 (+) Transcript_34357:141-1421(+)|eukprot:CAMPEP_0198200142 /NCGR_PEP_ID=MMETSP1445-20131203/3199_1 /TAXON_ID=36898 /ORGANISM="Pyramimonas sp., Strain CCMP2087" /LENGTH=426 /DNA_ID=CAMNT_0043870111 /DNA_START=72 /DNA_END=1352 /DNA_ORIENTATION=-